MHCAVGQVEGSDGGCQKHAVFSTADVPLDLADGLG